MTDSRVRLLTFCALLPALTATPAAHAKSVAPPPAGRVLLGVDRLITFHLPQLQGKRVGLLTHKAGVTGTGRLTVEALLDRGVDLRALFAPEHGIYGAVEGGFDVANTTYRRTGIPVHSLYGKTRRPTPKMLAGLDVVLVDLQDVGARFYTYISTVCYLLEEAAKAGVAVWVLDRPNPIGGLRVDGKTLERNRLGFTGIYPMPLLHGMTMGEMAWMLNEEYGYKARLKVVPMQGWRRDMFFGQTGLKWVAPSPNLPTWESTLIYPGLETIGLHGFLAEGRGTPYPFQLVGAPWVKDPEGLARRLADEGLHGLSFIPCRFTPSADALEGKRCGGVRMIVKDARRVDPMRIPLKILKVLKIMYPGAPGWQDAARSWSVSLGLPGGAGHLLLPGAEDELLRRWRLGAREFEATRKKYLLYKVDPGPRQVD